MASVRAKEKAKLESSLSAIDEADAWFRKNKINSSSVIFSSYADPELVRNHGATALVGVGTNAEGDRVGFALEVVSGRGVMESIILMPSGIATWHKDASIQARIAKIPLIDVLNKMAIAHKEHQIEDAVKLSQASSQSQKKPSSIDGPTIAHAVPIRAYLSGEYKATLVHKVESIGAIEYLFILIVFRKGSDSPVLFVTAEKNSMMSEMLSSLPDEMKEIMSSMPDEPFLGVFDESGRKNLGSSAQYEDIDGFEFEALSIAQRKFGLSSPFKRSI